MDNETEVSLYAFLQRRERELMHQITALSTQLDMRKIELEDVRIAKKQITDTGNHPELNAAFPRPAMGLPYEEMTIQQLICRALSDQFNPDGGTAAQIRAFIREAYGRDLDRGSFAPQLSRLKEKGAVEQFFEDNGKSRWRLKLRGTIEDAMDRAGLSDDEEHRTADGKIKRRRVRLEENERRD